MSDEHDSHVPVGMDVLVDELLPNVAEQNLDLFNGPPEYVGEEHETESFCIATNVFVDQRP